MLFSGKITNSVLTYLEGNGAQVEPLLAETRLPTEFLRDPSCWIESSEMEDFLMRLEDHFSHMISDSLGIMESAGQKCADLRSWGVLDSVIKMMEGPESIYLKPERFLSYFVSPPPPLGNVEKNNYGVHFQIPISPEEYPCIVRYIGAALEGLPGYFSSPLARVIWRETELAIEWTAPMKSLFDDEKTGRTMSPQFLSDLVDSLEVHQKELEKKNRELVIKNQELETATSNLAAAKSRLEKHVVTNNPVMVQTDFDIKEEPAVDIDGSLSNSLDHLMRLQDYMTRAQQLVTLLVAQGRKDNQVRSAMRRVDWEYVCKEFPNAVNSAQKDLKKVRKYILSPKAGASVKNIEKGPQTETTLMMSGKESELLSQVNSAVAEPVLKYESKDETSQRTPLKNQNLAQESLF